MAACATKQFTVNLFYIWFSPVLAWTNEPLMCLTASREKILTAHLQATQLLNGLSSVAAQSLAQPLNEVLIKCKSFFPEDYVDL